MLQDDEIVFDVETQKAFSEVGGKGNNADLKVSVVGVYSYRLDSYVCFEESQMSDFEAMIMRARRIIGFNIKHFDYPVVQPYLALSTKALPTLDLMEELARVMGFRPRLNDLAKATLGVQKSGHGLEAIRLYKEGRLDELKKYCLDDVRITKDLYEYGRDHGKVMIESGLAREIVSYQVGWGALPEPEEKAQHSLFG